MMDDQLTIVIRFEELPDNDEDDDDFLNKITLGKKYKSTDEPKLMIWSFEALIENFCQ